MAKTVKSKKFRHGSPEKVAHPRTSTPKVHRYKVKREEVINKYGVFTCRRCGGRKSVKSPGDLCYGCKHPEAPSRPEGKPRRGKRNKRSARDRRVRAQRRRYRKLLALRVEHQQPELPSEAEVLGEVLQNYHSSILTPREVE